MDIDVHLGPNGTGLAALATPANEPVMVVSRSFRAPRQLVWRCYTAPVPLVHLWGPKGATNPVSEVDLRVGGAWRQVMRFAAGNDYGYTSIFLEITPPERLVWRDAPDGSKFGDELPPTSFVTTMDLSEAHGLTTITVHVSFPTVAERDAVVRRGFAATITDSFDKFATYLTTLDPAVAGQQEL